MMEQAVAAYLCILLVSVAILDHLTKRIPTRLRADQAPTSGYGLIVAAHAAQVRAHGIE